MLTYINKNRCEVYTRHLLKRVGTAAHLRPGVSVLRLEKDWDLQSLQVGKVTSGQQRGPPAGGQPGYRAVLGVSLSGVTQRKAGQPGQPARHQPLGHLQGHRVVYAQPLQSMIIPS